MSRTRLLFVNALLVVLITGGAYDTILATEQWPAGRVRRRADPDLHARFVRARLLPAGLAALLRKGPPVPSENSIRRLNTPFSARSGDGAPDFWTRDDRPLIRISFRGKSSPLLFVF